MSLKDNRKSTACFSTLGSPFSDCDTPLARSASEEKKTFSPLRKCWGKGERERERPRSIADGKKTRYYFCCTLTHTSAVSPPPPPSTYSILVWSRKLGERLCLDETHAWYGQRARSCIEVYVIHMRFLLHVGPSQDG